jgi:glutaredoxin 3
MITIYTKDFCPYCTAAKELFKSLNVEYTEIDVTNDPEKLAKASAKSGLMTVPQIFAGEKSLGGYDDVNALHLEGKLLPLLELE